MCASVYTGGTEIEVQMSDQIVFRCMFKTWQIWCNDVSIISTGCSDRQKQLDETFGMENNVGWTDSLACSPEEECKTLCSLLVLWMTRTNQEDVSAFQFHFAWHESHAQGFHLRPISAWKRARVLRFLSHFRIGCFNASVLTLKWHLSILVVKKVALREWSVWIIISLTQSCCLDSWILVHVYSSAFAHYRFKGNKTQLGRETYQRGCCPETFGGWVGCYIHPSLLTTNRFVQNCINFYAQIVRPVLPGYKFVPCGFTRPFIVASVTLQLLVSAFLRRMSYVKQFGFYPIKPNNRSSRSFAVLCFVSTWCQWYIVRQWCLDTSVIIYGFYFTVSFLAAWLRFQAPALYHPYAVSFMKPLLPFHLEGGLSSHLIPAAWLWILLRMFL